MSLLVAALLATSQIVATEAPDWDAVFDQTSGWTGADGIYSIPLNSDDSLGAAAFGQTAFVFSDTFIGDVNAAGSRLAGSTLINNTLALLPAGAGADPAAIDFYWRKSAGAPAAVFEPNTPLAQNDEFYWMKDGVAIDGQLHLFAARMSKNPPPFSRKGVALISIPLDDRPPFRQQVQVDAPIRVAERPNFGEFTFGGAILDNSAEAGAPAPDGFVYIYGVEEVPLTKKALAARVPRDQFTDFSAWRYWDGGAWVTSAADARPMMSRVSTEMSVTPLENGRYLMVYMQDTIGGKIAVRVGDSPVGPWDAEQVVYTVPIPPTPAGLFSYHAKAHPSLSEPGSLLVSYNINTFGPFIDHFTYADIYRPRFVRLSLQ